MWDMVYWLNSDQEQDMDTSLDNQIQKTEYGVERKRGSTKKVKLWNPLER